MGPSLRCVLAPLLMLPFSVMLSSHAMAFRGVLVMLSRFVVGVLRHNTSPIFGDANKTRADEMRSIADETYRAQTKHIARHGTNCSLSGSVECLCRSSAGPASRRTRR